jgi:hypothetical protein
MKTGIKHISREEMHKAISSGKIPFSDHLNECPMCNAIFRVLNQYSGKDALSIIKPDLRSIRRFSAIPMLYQTGRRRIRQHGNLAFDSWASLPAFQLRDITPDFIRHLCLKAGRIKLEIIAERQQEVWEFTARVYDDNDVSMEWILSAGRRKLYPEAFGFYHWSSRNRPHCLKIFNRDNKIDFEKLSWA